MELLFLLMYIFFNPVGRKTFIDARLYVNLASWLTDSQPLSSIGGTVFAV